MTNAERRERRRAAALKGAETRRARIAQVGAHQVETPRAPTVEQTTRRADDREARRRANLRAVIDEAQRIRRESDLYAFVHSRRWDHRPGRWTAAQIDEARRFLAGFIRPDGIPQADPVRRKGRWRL